MSNEKQINLVFAVVFPLLSVISLTVTLWLSYQIFHLIYQRLLKMNNQNLELKQMFSTTQSPSVSPHTAEQKRLNNRTFIRLPSANTSLTKKRSNSVPVFQSGRSFRGFSFPNNNNQHHSSRISTPANNQSAVYSNLMNWTALCTLFFLLSQLTRVCVSIIFCVNIFFGSDKETKEEYPSILVLKSESRIPYLMSSLFGSLGIFMFVLVSFERLRVTMLHSQYRLTETSIKVVRIILLLSLVLIFAAVGTVSVSQRTGSILAAPIVVVFMCLSAWILYQFRTKTLHLSRQMLALSRLHRNQSSMNNNSTDDIDIRSNSSSNDEMKEPSIELGRIPEDAVQSCSDIPKSSANKKNNNNKKRVSMDVTMLANVTQLVDTSLRLTIVTTVAIISTSISLTLLVVARSMVTESLVTVFNLLLFSFDVTLNVLCLLCTFKQSKSLYRSVFGWLHSYCSKNFPLY